MRRNLLLKRRLCFQKACALLLILMSLQVSAEISVTREKGRTEIGQQRKINGTVKDKTGNPIIGATVSVKGTTTGTIAGSNGEFTLSNLKPDDVIVFSFVGMKTFETKVGNQATINAVLTEEFIGLDEVVAVGYGTQKKATLTGAISSVNGDELVETKTQNLQNMLTGKVSGVRVIQKTSEPGNFNNQFDIRGFGAPLVVIDGVPRGDIQRLDPEEIESVSVLKDASAAIYGVKGGNGVILITTKKGQKGAPQMKYSMYYGWQIPADILRPVGAVDRMTLYNDKSMRSTTMPQLTYTDADFEAYRNGTRTSTDWYDAVLRNSSPQQQHDFSVTGGSDAVNYFVNLGYTDQDGFWKTNDLNYNRVNIRSNLDAKISNRLRFSLKLNGILDNTNRPVVGTTEVFKTLWRTVPNDKIYANDNPLYLSKLTGDVDNVVAMTNSDISGFSKNVNKIFRTSAELSYEIPYIKGLTAKGLFSFDNTVSDNSSYRKQYNVYDYNSTNEAYTATGKNAPTSLSRAYWNTENILYQVQMDYKGTFAKKHNVSASLIFEASHNKGDNIQASREFSIPLPYLFAGNSVNQVGTADPNGMPDFAYNSFIGRLNYDFKGKYLVEFSFRDDGSSKFKSGQYGFFPGGSLGWRISEEPFIKDRFYFVDNLKLRGSYGKLGDDGNYSYQFLSGYNYPNTAGANNSNFPTGYVFGGVYTNALGFRAAANPNITWLTNKPLDLGLDIDLWKGKLGFTFDVFRRDRSGLMVNRLVSLPGTFGSLMPAENLESDCTKGFEIEVRHQNRIGELIYNVQGNLSITRTMYLYREKAPAGNSYDNWRNNTAYRYNDIWFGTEGNGRYTSYQEIATSDLYTNNSTLPGDYKYQDWNNDGVIDASDQHPIATTTNPSGAFQDQRNYPLMNFGINLSAKYHGFDLSLLFQGAAMSYISYGEQLSSPLWWYGNALSFFMDRWHPVDPKMDPYNPSNQWISGNYSYGGTTADLNSTYNIQNGAYLRLKSAELGYTIPKSVLKRTGIKDTRLFVNCYNILTITGVKGLDPEHPTDAYGYMYPLDKTLNIGANITF